MKKKIMSILLVAILIASMFTVSAFAADMRARAIYRYQYITNGVHVRTGPSTAYPSYGMMWKDEIFYQNSWDYNDSGYMYGHPALETVICESYGGEINGWTYQPGNFIDISYD